MTIILFQQPVKRKVTAIWLLNFLFMSPYAYNFWRQQLCSFCSFLSIFWRQLRKRIIFVRFPSFHSEIWGVQVFACTQVYMSPHQAVKSLYWDVISMDLTFAPFFLKSEALLSCLLRYLILLLEVFALQISYWGYLNTDMTKKTRSRRSSISVGPKGDKRVILQATMKLDLLTTDGDGYYSQECHINGLFNTKGRKSFS